MSENVNFYLKFVYKFISRPFSSQVYRHLPCEYGVPTSLFLFIAIFLEWPGPPWPSTQSYVS